MIYKFVLCAMYNLYYVFVLYINFIIFEKSKIQKRNY